MTYYSWANQTVPHGFGQPTNTRQLSRWTKDRCESYRCEDVEDDFIKGNDVMVLQQHRGAEHAQHHPNTARIATAIDGRTGVLAWKTHKITGALRPQGGVNNGLPCPRRTSKCIDRYTIPDPLANFPAIFIHAKRCRKSFCDDGR